MLQPQAEHGRPRLDVGALAAALQQRYRELEQDSRRWGTQRMSCHALPCLPLQAFVFVLPSAPFPIMLVSSLGGLLDCSAM